MTRQNIPVVPTKVPTANLFAESQPEHPPHLSPGVGAEVGDEFGAADTPDGP